MSRRSNPSPVWFEATEAKAVDARRISFAALNGCLASAKEETSTGTDALGSVGAGKSTRAPQDTLPGRALAAVPACLARPRSPLHPYPHDRKGRRAAPRWLCTPGDVGGERLGRTPHSYTRPQHPPVGSTAPERKCGYSTAGSAASMVSTATLFRQSPPKS